MSLAKINSRAISGIDALPVEVEIHLAGGLPALSIVGLAETAVKESKDRVRAALLNSGFEFPARRITVNLAPANLPKEGGGFDLPIAIGILAASGQIAAAATGSYEFCAELALSGELRPVRGCLPAALAAAADGHHLAVAPANADEAALAGACNVYTADHLLALTAHLRGVETLSPYQRRATAAAVRDRPDLCDVVGQARAKRALEVAAAGEHNLLMVGPPGSGKSMLATRLPGLLPPMSTAQALETAAVESISNGGFDPRRWAVRPFRAPHHTASGAALVGGGSHPRPGEVSLAHNGVLFLDELTEYDRRVLDVLREPLENGRIVVSRAMRQAEFPARFQLIAAMNPCPCGYSGDRYRPCRCDESQVRRYQARVSGPLLDRIDIQVEVPGVAPASLAAVPVGSESSADVRSRVLRARERQRRRQGCSNARLAVADLDVHCHLQDAGSRILQQAMTRLGLSARAYHRILKVARTIADLADRRAIDAADLGEAIGYRSMDRQPR